MASSRCWTMVFFGISLVLLANVSHTGGKTNESTLKLYNGATRYPEDESFLSFFRMVNFFLGSVVQKQTLDEVSIEEFKEDDKMVAAIIQYFLGYIICALTGLLLIIIVTLVGCCCCCCRCCCCKCGGGKVKIDKNEAVRCKTIVCSVFLFIITAMMLTFAVTSIVSSIMLKQELVQNSKGTGYMMADLHTSLAAIDLYKDNAVVDLRRGILEKVNDTKIDVFDSFDKLPRRSTETLANVTRAGPTLRSLHTFVSKLENLTKTFETMSQSTEIMITNVTHLVKKIDSSKTNIANEIKKISCQNDSDCNRLKQDCEKQTTQLQIGVNFTKVSNMSEAIEAIKKAKDSGIDKKVKDSIRQVENISHAAEKQLSGNLGDIKRKIDEGQRKLHSGYEEFESSMKKYNFLDERKGINKTASDVTEVSQVMYWALLGMSSYLLLIILCNLFGLLVGSCCKRPAVDAAGRRQGGCCVSSCGSNWLMAGVYLGFLLFWLYMLITVVLFLVGGIMQTEVCRHVTRIDTSPAVKSLDNLVKNYIKSNISILETAKNCEKNQALYTALQLESNVLNITELLDLDKLGVKEMAEKLKNTSVNIGKVELLSPELNSSITNLDKSMKSIDFNLFKNETEKPIVQVNVTQFADGLKKLAAFNAQLKNEAERLKKLQSESIDPLVKQQKELQKNVLDAETTVKTAALGQMPKALKLAEDSISKNGSRAMGYIINDTTDEIIGLMYSGTQKVVNSVKNDVANCRTVYVAFSNAVTVSCKFLLYPVNALWFSFGGFMVVMLFGMMCAVKLSRLYRLPSSGIGPIHDEKDLVELQLRARKLPKVKKAQVQPSDY